MIHSFAQALWDKDMVEISLPVLSNDRLHVMVALS